MSMCARSLCALATALGVLVIAGMPVVTAEPIKFGTSQSLTCGLTPLGKAMLLTEQMWVEQVNARGGLLGRPIELVFYDDQSNPATDPGIYTKILDVDHADILLGNGTNFVSSVMPIVVQRGRPSWRCSHSRWMIALTTRVIFKSCPRRDFLQHARRVDTAPNSYDAISARRRQRFSPV